MSKERRRAPRKDIGLRALILDVDGSVIGECKMADISAVGARLIMKAPLDTPERFVLVLSLGGAVRRQCEVAWRFGNSIGVQFVVAAALSEETASSHVKDALSRIMPGARG